MTVITGKSLSDIQAHYHSVVASVLENSETETLLLSHFGDFIQPKVDSTIKILESTIIEQGDKRQVMRRVCSVLIEVLQNIALHSAKDANGRMHSYLVVVKAENNYKIFCGNLILQSDRERLSTKMAELVHMDKNSLRKMFIETLCNEDFTYKGGAGLGLLTIAKRSKEEVKYAIHEIDELFGYFQMEIVMDGE